MNEIKRSRYRGCLLGGAIGEPMRLKPWVISEAPTRLTHPDLDVFAAVTRAIHQECRDFVITRIKHPRERLNAEVD